MKINCSLEYERRKKFKFIVKFKEIEVKDRLLQLKEIFLISKKLEKKLSITRMQKNEIEMKCNEEMGMFSWKCSCCKKTEGS
jgi:hypothetical protein